MSKDNANDQKPTGGTGRPSQKGSTTPQPAPNHPGGSTGSPMPPSQRAPGSAPVPGSRSPESTPRGG